MHRVGENPLPHSTFHIPSPTLHPGVSAHCESIVRVVLSFSTCVMWDVQWEWNGTELLGPVAHRPRQRPTRLPMPMSIPMQRRMMLYDNAPDTASLVLHDTHTMGWLSCLQSLHIPHCPIAWLLARRSHVLHSPKPTVTFPCIHIGLLPASEQRRASHLILCP